MSAWLNTRLGYSVNLKEEDVIINGDAANSVQGLSALASPFTYTPATSDNGMDVLARAAGALMGKGYSVDGVLLNAQDYTDLRLLKSTVGTYLFVGDAGKGPDDENDLGKCAVDLADSDDRVPVRAGGDVLL